MRWTLTLADDGVDAPPAADAPAAAPAAAIPGQTAGRFSGVAIVEGVVSGDGRTIEPDALTWRDLPVPMMGLDVTTEEHSEAVVIGSIDTLSRDGQLIRFAGPWASTPDAARIRGLVRDGHLRGVSADLDDIEYDVTFVEPDVVDNPDGSVTVPVAQDQLRVTKGRIMGATVVPFPAFQEAYISDDDPTVDIALAASAAPVHTTDSVEGDYDGPAAVAALPDPLPLAVAEAVFAVIPDDADPEAVDPAVCWGPHHVVDGDGVPGAANVDECTALLDRLDEVDDADRDGVREHLSGHLSDAGVDVPPAEAPAPPPAVTASGPVRPPAGWFDDPGLSAYTPLTVDDDGRVYGHAAAWDSCHISYPGRCVPPPKSRTNYSYFHTGEVACDDGSRVAVGHIALRGGHAPLDASPAAAAAHYDDTDSCVADVCCGEDRHGIWVAGAMRPDATPSDVRTAMASGVSGDWRRLGGTLELIHLSSVNVPGFLKPRQQIRERHGLVAAAIIDLPPEPERDDVDVSFLDDRTVDVLVASLARRIGADDAARIARLSQRAGV